MIKNLSEEALATIRKEGCFIRRMTADGVLAECVLVAIQDGMVFTCPFHLLEKVQDSQQKKKELYSNTSRRCGCGRPSCDTDSIMIRKSLKTMGLTVSIILYM